MNAMIDYSIQMLEAISRFLGSEPIIYLFALICLAVIVKAVKDIIQ